MTDGIWEYDKRYLRFSCQSLEFSVKPGERAEGSFSIQSDREEACGDIYSSDTRMQCLTPNFTGSEAVIEYCFNAANLDSGSQVNGEFVIISSEGEYSLPYCITVLKSQLESSMGHIRNLFHFANLAKSNWKEAVELFYSPDFISIFRKNDKNLETMYLGLSRMTGNQENVEEFLIETNKKAPITYQTDMEGFRLEDVLDSQTKTLAITKSGWGYLRLKVSARGGFIELEQDAITTADFQDDLCRLNFTIDATRLHHGLNEGYILIADTCNEIEIPVSVMMQEGEDKLEREHQRKRATMSLMRGYIEMKFRKITRNVWAERCEEAIEILKELNPDDIMTRLYQVQMLITRDRFNEAKWYLDRLRQEIYQSQTDEVAQCYYMYLSTLFNRDENYLQVVIDEIENAFSHDETQWRFAWFLLYLDEEYARNPEAKWHFLEEQFKLGCTSPVLFCEAVLLFQSHPAYILQLGAFEQNVVWFAAKHRVLDSNMIEQLQYQCARVKEYSPLLFRTLCEVYQTNKTAQTIAVICRLLVLGDRKGPEYFPWYARGVEREVRVTRLYDYYMMSADITDSSLEIPKMVLMYFAYQCNLDYEYTSYLYAYVVRNRDKYPELERNYRIAMERFVLDQIKLGHMNENLACLYDYILAPQMLRDDLANAFAPLLFMHKVTVGNPKITSVVIVHEKINGESIYPVSHNFCMLPVYGNEYRLFLQDDEGNRYTKRIAYINEQLMDTKRLLPYVESMIENRLSFDIYLCEQDKNYVTITHDNVKRFKHLAESELVIEEFRKEIRTRLLRFYYENDMIGELDTFLDETEADAMEMEERAEFIRFLISRGMFDKAYLWVKQYGLNGVNMKAIARLVSKRIVSNQFTKEEFLVNVAYYIYKNMKYDENILRYLMMYYEGKTTRLRNIWKSAVELELDTSDIMDRMLQQMCFTQVAVPEKNEILLTYASLPKHDDELVEKMLEDAAYDYFVQDALTEPAIFNQIYMRYRKSGETTLGCKLALLRFWSEHSETRKQIVRDTIAGFVRELIQKGICFPFFRELTENVPYLHYYKDKYFVEYRTMPASTVRIHYLYDKEGAAASDETAVCYVTEDMKEMYEGIYVAAFDLFQDEVLQYYITEKADGAELVTQSGTLTGTDQVHGEGRFGMLDDMILAHSMQDETTAGQLIEEYMEEDYCARELFRVI